MVFTKDYFFSALLGGVVGGILTILTLKILEARGPFLESPGNFTGPKSNIQIEI